MHIHGRLDNRLSFQNQSSHPSYCLNSETRRQEKKRKGNHNRGFQQYLYTIIHTSYVCSETPASLINQMSKNCSDFRNGTGAGLHSLPGSPSSGSAKSSAPLSLLPCPDGPSSSSASQRWAQHWQQPREAGRDPRQLLNFHSSSEILFSFSI